MAEKAVVAQIDFGYTKIEGLMLPDGSYRMGVTQVTKLMPTLATQNNATREVKALLSKESLLFKLKSELNSQPVNTISIDQFIQLIKNVVIQKKNEEAINLLMILAEESIERRFNHAFGVKCTEEDYNKLLTIRWKRLLARRDYTDVLMERHIDLYGTKPIPEDYKVWTVKVNKALFGCQQFKCNRDNMTTDQQEMITDFERTVKRFALKYDHATPMELIDRTLETF
jgi:hypothetical protein